ncbi:amidohydrolase family protein [Hymenobacter nivis]|nr:amidohydrolase family protein [Hymenobacter nivis]
MRFQFTFLLALLGAPALAQVPTPAGPQAKPVLITGATLHVGNGTVVPNAAVAFAQGKLTYAGPASGFTADKAGYETVDGTGQDLYPGLILPNTTLGLTDVESIRATVDEAEVGILNPNVRSLIAYNTDSDVLPTLRMNGVLLAQPTPRGGLLTGQSSVVQLDAWNWQDAVVRADEGQHLSWPQLIVRTNPAEDAAALERRQKARETNLRDLEQLFGEAAAYRQLPTGRRENLRLTALAGLFDGSKTLYLHADYGKEIIESVRFAKRLGVQKVAVVGGRDAWMVLDFLKQNDVAVVVSRLHALPRRDADDYDQPYKLPAQLQAAGIRYCLDYEGSQEAPGGRNLAFIAGTAAAYGLTKEQALTAITLAPAQLMGIDKAYGSLETGKSATLVISKGDLLDMRTNNVTSAFIDGRRITLETKQTALNRKFLGKYGLE